MLLIADFPYRPQRKVSLLDVQSALGALAPAATREKKKGKENWTRGRWISLSVPELWPKPEAVGKVSEVDGRDPELAGRRGNVRERQSQNCIRVES